MRAPPDPLRRQRLEDLQRRAAEHDADPLSWNEPPLDHELLGRVRDGDTRDRYGTRGRGRRAAEYHGMEGKTACSCTMVGTPAIVPAIRPKLEVAKPWAWRIAGRSRRIRRSRSVRTCRVEPAVAETDRVEAVPPQVGGGLVLRPDADQARLETRGVEAGEPPGEQTRDAVRARAAHAKFVAQVEYPDLLRQGPSMTGDRRVWGHAPGWTRTTDPQLRRLLLYPTELRARS